MNALPFEFPSPAIPFVIAVGQASGVAGPLRVLFDTGNASPFMLLVGEQSAVAAQARRTNEAPVVFDATAGGGVAAAAPARLESFRLGRITLNDVAIGITAAVDTLGAQLPGGVDVLIGQAFAMGRVVSVDYPGRRIDFAARPGPAASALSMTMTPDGPLGLIDATINGRGPFRLVLDTGANRTLLSPEAADHAGVGEAGRTRCFGGAGGTQSTGRRETASLEVGGHSFPGSRVLVTDIIAAVSEAAGAPIDGVLGANLLVDGKLTMDFPGRRAWIERPAPESQT